MTLKEFKQTMTWGPLLIGVIATIALVWDGQWWSLIPFWGFVCWMIYAVNNKKWLRKFSSRFPGLHEEWFGEPYKGGKED